MALVRTRKIPTIFACGKRRIIKTADSTEGVTNKLVRTRILTDRERRILNDYLSGSLSDLDRKRYFYVVVHRIKNLPYKTMVSDDIALIEAVLTKLGGNKSGKN